MDNAALFFHLLGALLFVAGIVLAVHLGSFGYGSGWVDASLALCVVALVLGGLGGQRPKQARKLASKLAAGGGPVSAELRGLLDDPVSRVENYGSLLLVLVILVLMVFKP